MDTLSLFSGYKEIIKQRKEYWDSFFQKFDSVTGEDHSITDITNTLSIRENLMNSLVKKETEQKKRISKISLKTNVRTSRIYKGKLLKCTSSNQKNTSRSQLRNIDNYANKKEAYKEHNSEKSFKIKNEACRENDLSKENYCNVRTMYEFLQKSFNEDIDFATFLWVKNKIEEDSNSTIEESLRDKEFRKNKVIVLAKVLSKDDVLKYFKFYLHYIKLLQYVGSTKDNSIRVDIASKENHQNVEIESNVKNNFKLKEIKPLPNLAKKTKKPISDNESNVTILAPLQKCNSISVASIELKNMVVFLNLDKGSVSSHFLGLCGINLKQFHELRNTVDNILKSRLTEKICYNVLAEAYFEDNILLRDYHRRAMIDEIKKLTNIIPQEQLLSYVKYHVFNVRSKMMEHFK